VTTYTTVMDVARAVAREIGVPGPAYAMDYPYRYDRATGNTTGMTHFGSGRGNERQYRVNLGDGRTFEGTKHQLFEWAALHLPQGVAS
jgi:hypothetical protein